MEDFSSFKERIGVSFKNEDLLKEALTHRSYLNENPRWPVPHNERLEYLGDAVLELVATDYLFKKFPKYAEGQLTVIRAALVNYQSLATVAREMGLEEFILTSRGERSDNQKAREAILANAVEAVIGAVYLDQGYEASRKLIERFILTMTDEVVRTGSYRDPKSELQELIQERMKITPSYRVLEEQGLAHERIFKVGVYFDSEKIEEGEGESKQSAEVEAARKALLKYK